MKNFASKGLTLVETLIGAFLLVIVFLGIFGAFQLATKAIGYSRARVIATAFANQQIEKIRSLPYNSVGITGGFPDGVLGSQQTVVSNNITYTISRRIDFVVDKTDGVVPPEDECPNDYKKVEISVSWGQSAGSKVVFVTDVAPENLAQECATGGGILYISVFDAYGVFVASPLIEVMNPDTESVLKMATPAEGKHYFSLPAGTYKVNVSKDGFSSERTYNNVEVATPEKPHPLVIEGKLTEISFSIDKISSFTVKTLSPWGLGSFTDSFSDTNKIAEMVDIEISEGKVRLTKTDGNYKSSGHLISVDIEPENMIRWDKLSFNDEKPQSTEIKYQVLYFTEPDWLLIPDSDLPGNSQGLTASPADLSALDIISYPKLRLFGVLSTEDPLATPVLNDWQVSWITVESTPIPNAAFHLQGQKIIGLDGNEDPVPKYSQNLTSNSQGQSTVSPLEWDLYQFSVSQVAGFDLEDIDPKPQPVSLAPNVNTSVKLYLKAENSLLIVVQNSETTVPVFSASVRLENSALGYDTTQYTNEKGQTYFMPLETGVYTLAIQAAGYSNYSGSASITGDTTKIAAIIQIE